MLKKAKNIAVKTILYIVIIQLLNVSLFSQNIPVSLASNYDDRNIINSVYEFIAEVILEKKDAFSEKNDLAKKVNSFVFKVLEFNLFNNYQSAKTQPVFYTVIQNSFSICNTVLIDNVSSDVVIPPPKAVA